MSDNSRLPAILLVTLSLAPFTSSQPQTAGVASEFTRQKNLIVASQLPFDDDSDFKHAVRGFIATHQDGLIRDDNGNLIYDMNQFSFIDGKAPPTVNPSLWRRSLLNSIHGLFKVADDIYQIRGFGLANMSLVRGKRGWIVIDPLSSVATARAAMRLVAQHLGERPITAVIFTHSRINHFGGIHGIVSEDDVKNGKVPVYAPAGFFDHATREYIMAGHAMRRRASYMYGNLLPKNATGNVGVGIGQVLSGEPADMVAPTESIDRSTDEGRIIDGVTVEFMVARESEAPAELMLYFPDLNAASQPENITHACNSLCAIPSASVKNGQKWSQYIDRILQRYGDEAEYSFGSYRWPIWGNKNVTTFWEQQRDIYRFVHDQTLRLANHGHGPAEIVQSLKLPGSLAVEFYNRGYYGSFGHNVRAQFQLYFGWFDGNPSNLDSLPPVAAGKKYVEFMGGARLLLEKARQSYARGEYRWLAEVLRHLVFAEPDNEDARGLLADTYEQLAYVTESGSWRNFYLSGAMELRRGVKAMPVMRITAPPMVDEMSTELFFNFLATRFNGVEAGDMRYDFNIIFPGVKEQVALIIGNGVVNPRIGATVKNPTATIFISRRNLAEISFRQTTLADLKKKDEVKIIGNKKAVVKFIEQLDYFDSWFNIATP